MRDLLAVAVALALLVGLGTGVAHAESPRYGDIIGPVTPTSMGVHIPKDEAEYNGMDPADRLRTLKAIYSRLPEWNRLVARDAVQISSVSSIAAQRSTSAGGRAPRPLLVPSAWGQCQVQWSDAGGGTWLRGYGKTWASETLALIQVDWVDFYKDGGWQTGVGAQGCTYCTIRESVTGWIWRWSWDHATWTTSSGHTARGASGTYYLGPGAACQISLNQ